MTLHTNNAELIHNLPESTYHAATDSLSASGAKVLLGKRPRRPTARPLRSVASSMSCYSNRIVSTSTPC
jgi:hypothetical protein